MTVKLKGPSTLSSFSAGGTSYTVVGGIVDVNAEHVADAKVHGFLEMDEDDDLSEPTEDVSKMGRTELFATLRGMGVTVPNVSPTSRLRSILQEAIAERAGQSEARGVAETMNVAEMRQFLLDHEVVVEDGDEAALRAQVQAIVDAEVA